MANNRAILHSDMNSFYASVEMMLNPALKGKPVAVCGSTEERHGIVLAKSDLAKKAGVKTGMVNWEARSLCPGLIVVPPQYDQYLKYSKLAHDIYQRYTNLVEPFGMDECWLDVTGSGVYGSGTQLQEMDDTVTIYRGVTSHNQTNIKALSWTLDRDKAEWFAHRFGENGTVYEAQIDKENILALFNGRNEAEVIVDPRHLKNIIESPEPVQGFDMTM